MHAPSKNDWTDFENDCINIQNDCNKTKYHHDYIKFKTNTPTIKKKVQQNLRNKEQQKLRVIVSIQLVQMTFIHRSSMCPWNYSRFNVIIDYVIILVST